MGFYKFLMWCTSCDVDEPAMDVQRGLLLPEFIRGVHEFINVAKANTRNSFMCCPCVQCKNEKDYSCSKVLHEHLFTSGFIPNYICWTKHGERGVIMEEDEEEEDGMMTTLLFVVLLNTMPLMILQWGKLKKS
jgi:hypothetical protein